MIEYSFLIILTITRIFLTKPKIVVRVANKARLDINTSDRDIKMYLNDIKIRANSFFEVL